MPKQNLVTIIQTLGFRLTEKRFPAPPAAEGDQLAFWFVLQTQGTEALQQHSQTGALALLGPAQSTRFGSLGDHFFRIF